MVLLVVVVVLTEVVVVGLGVVGLAVVGFEVVGLAVVGFGVVVAGGHHVCAAVEVVGAGVQTGHVVACVVGWSRWIWSPPGIPADPEK